jgi:4-alpha-glucanotransferase
MKENYRFLLSTPLASRWKKIGIERKAGIIVPLFFIWSKKSVSIGEIPDLKILIDWCQKVGFKILQLLPLNDAGFNFSPYSLQSSFALDPIYLSLSDLIDVKKESLKEELDVLRKKFPTSTKRVNYKIKGEKLKKLWEIFLKRANLNSKKFRKFKEKNKYWLKDYSIFRILKENFKEKSWEKWPKNFREKNKKEIEKFERLHKKEINFQNWLQWQIFEQLKEVKNYAQKRGIFLKGDLPWLVSRDSADVWSNPQYFDLNFSAGAPPDAFSKRGQRWGMPPLNWERILKDDFIYFKEKLKYAQNFYHLFRIDHVVGIFRIWKIKISEPLKNKGKNGFFDPKDEKIWEERGRKILMEMIKNTKMLPCAEDLGTIPQCCPKVLWQLGIPGISVQRWTKNWRTGEFIKPENYNPLSISTLSTHDTSNFLDWWQNEAEKREKRELLKIVARGKKIGKRELIFKSIKAVNNSSSIFCLLLITEWLFLNKILKGKPSHWRFNFPGKVSKKNWSIRMPISLEEILKNPINFLIKRIIKESKRN